MVKRRAVMTLTVAGLVLGAAACGTGTQQRAGQQSAESASGSITFWSFLKGSDAVAAAFNKAHPGLTVKFEKQTGGPDYYNKLSNAVKSGSVPDVAVGEYVRLPELVSLGEVQDLTDAVGATVKQTFPASVQQMVDLGGKTWGLPRDAGPMLYFYRKDFFDSHNLTAPKTWAEYRALAADVKAAAPKARAGAFLTDDSNLMIGLSWQAGATWFKTSGDSWSVGINDAASVKVAQYWQGLVRDDLVGKYPQYTDEFWRGVQSDEVVGYFCASWCAGGLQSTVPGQSGKWAVAPLPNWDGRQSSAMWGGSSFVVPKGAKNEVAAVEFIKWITTDPDGIKAWYATGTSSMYPASPALVPVAQQGFVTDYYGGQNIFAVGTSSYDAVSPGWSWGPAMASTDQAITAGLGNVGQGSTELTDVLNSAQTATVKAMQDRGLSVSAR